MREVPSHRQFHFLFFNYWVFDIFVALSLNQQLSCLQFLLRMLIDGKGLKAQLLFIFGEGHEELDELVVRLLVEGQVEDVLVVRAHA